jgi:hypothetical protein
MNTTQPTQPKADIALAEVSVPKQPGLVRRHQQRRPAQPREMFLKNYTSDVPVLESIQRIEAVLLKCGVRGIMKEYGPAQKITAITFKVEEGGCPWTIRLPVNEAKATEMLWMDHVGNDAKYLSKDGNRLEGWSCRKRKTRADF